MPSPRSTTTTTTTTSRSTKASSVFLCNPVTDLVVSRLVVPIIPKEAKKASQSLRREGRRGRGAAHCHLLQFSGFYLFAIFNTGMICPTSWLRILSSSPFWFWNRKWGRIVKKPSCTFSELFLLDPNKEILSGQQRKRLAHTSHTCLETAPGTSLGYILGYVPWGNGYVSWPLQVRHWKLPHQIPCLRPFQEQWKLSDPSPYKVRKFSTNRLFPFHRLSIIFCLVKP